MVPSILFGFPHVFVVSVSQLRLTGLSSVFGALSRTTELLGLHMVYHLLSGDISKFI